MGGELAELTSAQRRFVEARGARFDSRGWVTRYEDNLYNQLHPDSLTDLVACGEIDRRGRGDRIRAPHSSTALAVNTFDPWRKVNPTGLSRGLGFEVTSFVGFEQKRGFGLDRPAQPDVEFLDSADRHVAVEVKLREPYGSVSNPFADKYFNKQGLWDGLPGLRQLAQRISTGELSYTTLHAAQLIKHALGMRHTFGEGFVLAYYWHRLPGEVGDRHAAELAQFKAAAGNDISLRSVTVAQLLDRIDPGVCPEGWHEYLTGRYIQSTSTSSV